MEASNGEAKDAQARLNAVDAQLQSLAPNDAGDTGDVSRRLVHSKGMPKNDELIAKLLEVTALCSDDDVAVMVTVVAAEWAGKRIRLGRSGNGQCSPTL